MSKFREMLNSFSAGELSPRMRGRSELELYKKGCQVVENMIVLPQGGAAKRPGSIFITKDEISTNTAVKAVSYSISKTESYIILFTLDTQDSSAEANCGIYIWDIANEQYLDLDITRFNGVGFDGMDKFTGFTTAAQLKEIYDAPFGNAIFFAQKDVPPFALDFTHVEADGTGTVYLFPFWAYAVIGDTNPASSPTAAQVADAWPYTDDNALAITAQVSAASGLGLTLTFVGAPILETAHIGSLIKITGDTPTRTGVGHIRTRVSGTSGTVDSLVNFEDTNVTPTFAFTAWSDVRGWPRCVCFFENRIFYGGTTAQPQTIWASKNSQLQFMRAQKYTQEVQTLTNADALAFSIGSSELNAVQWLAPAKSLSIGTLGREYIAFGPDQTQGFGALNVAFSGETAHGSKNVKPIRKDNTILFVQRSGRKIREFVFNFQEDSYRGYDIMSNAEHMIRRTRTLQAEDLQPAAEIEEIIYQEADNQLTWFKDSLGGIFAMTLNKDVGVQAFHYHKLGGNGIFGMPTVYSMCAAPSPDGTHDDLWLVVRRDINDIPTTCLERITRAFELDELDTEFTDIEDKPIYLDCAIMNIAGAPTTTHTGYSALAEQEVSVLADGIYIGEKTVDASGVIELDTEATEVIAGFIYTSILQVNPINMGSVIGSSLAVPKSLDTMVAKFYRTVGCKFGPSTAAADLEEIEFRDQNSNMDEPLPLFSGDKELSYREGHYLDPVPTFVNESPFPFEITALSFRGITSD